MIIRKANVEENKLLSELAINSKSYWNYSEEFIEAFRNELKYSKKDLNNPNNHFVVAELKNKIIGFYALVPLDQDKFELEALFIDPEYIGKGIGIVLFQDAKSFATVKGVKSIIIQGDPNAEKFYKAMGCKKIGNKESESIPGRYLPLFSYSVNSENNQYIKNKNNDKT
ncbi:MAG: GNAT family N-acetyltransferase [Ignavibacteria bacterium]|nr:GNAT family N-acetyltransferase [Ignavibacteria bacterium]MBT8382096.1 GNAT family N-acetyltransferase [Ignavibacteria bacterium]MBT8391115.1 GNAT family N-acetyltransferase [Ignavibacteria bacterium]NNJ51825.1 GNAT family N-acetyltransferase [Ignavibacteriaceae bacterium]NNL19992.1 GNAT family N-acetyltransferase [Ignavibacteriaceae bacterium]